MGKPELPDRLFTDFPTIYVSTEKLSKIREELGLPPYSPVYQRRYHVVDREKKDNE